MLNGETSGSPGAATGPGEAEETAGARPSAALDTEAAPSPAPPQGDDEADDAPVIEMVSGDEAEALGGEPQPPPLRTPALPRPPERPPGGARETAPDVVAQLQAETWKERLALLEKELGLEQDRERRALLEHEMGELAEWAAKDEIAAAKHYGKALVSDPTLRPNVWALKRICERRGSWQNLLKLIDAEIRFAQSDEERAELWVERGVVLEDRLGDEKEARAAFEQALTLAPRSLRALMALEKIAARAGDVAMLKRLCRLGAVATEDRRRRVGLLVDLARLEAAHPAEAGAEGKPADRALAVLREAYALGEDEEFLLGEMEKLAEAEGRTEEVLGILDLRAVLVEGLLGQRPEDPEHRRRIADELGALRRRQAQLVREPARAWGYLERAREQLPDEPLLLMDLCEFGETLGRWGGLAELLEARAQLAPEGLRPGLLLQRADALRRAGRDAEADGVEAELAGAAEGTWLGRAAAELGMLRRADVAALARLREAEGMQVLAGGTPSGIVDSEWAAAAFTAAGALHERQGDEAAAMAAYQRAIAAVEGYRPAVDALERCYARGGLHRERAELLEAELGRAALPVRKEYLLEELLELRLGRGDSDAALETARRLCELRPDVTTRARVVELCRTAGRWEEALEQLERLGAQLEAEGQVARAIDARLERAWILEQRLNAPERAIGLLEELAQTVQAPLVMAELRRLLRQAGRHEALVAALEREVGATHEPERAVRLLVELAEVYEHDLGKPDEAARVYRAVLDRAPGETVALRALVRLHERQGDAAALAHSLTLSAEAAPSSAARAFELLQLGEVLEDRLGAMEQAEEAFRGSFEQEASAHAGYGRWRVAVRRRDGAAIEAGWGPLGELIRPELRAAWVGEGLWREADPAEATARLTAAQGAAPQAPGSAVTRWRLAARAGDAAALAEALTAMASGTSDERLAAALALRAAILEAAAGKDARQTVSEALARAGEDAATLVAACELVDDAEPEVLARRAQLAAEPVALGWRLERIRALTKRGRLAEASAEGMAALAEAPEDIGVLLALRRIARAGQDRRGAAQVTARLGGLLADRARAAELLAEAARSFDELGDVEDAALAWMEVLRRRPEDDEAYRRAHAALGRIDDAVALEHLVSEHLGHVPPGEVRRALVLERAELRQRLGEVEGAIEDLRSVLAEEPQQARALRSLAELLAEKGELAEAIHLYDRFIEAASEPEVLCAAHVRLAELQQKVGDPALAVASLQRALGIAPDRRDIVERLIGLLFEQGEHASAVAQLRTLARLTSDKAERIRIEQRIAKVCTDSLGDGRGALEALTRALEEEPLHIEILARMATLAESLGERQRRDNLLGRAADAARAQIAAQNAAPGPYRTLERVLALRGDEDGRLFAAQCAALAAGEPYLPRTTVEPTKELSVASWERVFSPLVRGVALEVWRETRDASQRMYAPELGAYGVSKGDRQNAKSVPVAWIPVDKIVRALGGGAYELYAATTRPDLCVAVGPALIVGTSFADRLSASTRFRVARTAALLRERWGPLEALDDAELELYFAACARVAGASWMPPSSPTEAKLEDRAKQIGKHIDRRAKKALQALAPRFGEIGDVLAWRREVLDGVAYLALAVGGDLAAAFGELKLDMLGGLGQSLARLAVSEDMARLRRELGLRG